LKKKKKNKNTNININIKELTKFFELLDTPSKVKPSNHKASDQT